VQALNKKH